MTTALVVLEPDSVGKIGEDDIRLHVASYVEQGLMSKIAIPEENVTTTAEPLLTSVGKVDKKSFGRAICHRRRERDRQVVSMAGAGGAAAWWRDSCIARSLCRSR